MKRVVNLIGCVLITIMVAMMSFVPCFAVSLSGSVNVPSQVTKNKSFTAELQAQCNEKIGVVMFTVTNSDNIKYKSCKVNDGSSGYIEIVQSDSMLKIMYINTAGINISDVHTLVEITFVSDDAVGNGYIEIHTSYSTNINEEELSDSNGTIYDIEIVEKAVNDPPPATGTRVNSNGSSSSNVSKNKNSSKTNSSTAKERVTTSGVQNNAAEAVDDAGDNATASQHKTVNALSDTNGVLLFVAGGIFVLAVVSVIVCSYFMGKRHAKTASTEEATENKEDIS